MTRLKARSGGPRRWPDVMIGVLVLALLGGFGALLLEQRPRPVAQVPVTAEPSTTVVIPASPGTVSEVPTPQTTTTPQTTSNQTTGQTTAQTGTDQSGQTTTGQTQTAQTQTAQTQTDPSSATPAQTQTAPSTQTATQPQTSTATDQSGQTTTGQGAAGQTATGQTATTVPQTTDNGTAAATEIPPVPATPPVGPLTTLPLPENAQPVQPSVSTETAQPQTQTSVAPRAGGAVAASAQRTPLRSDYRISLGSFSSERTVRTQTAGVSGLGYTVYPIDIGSGYVAQVGPFADEATARQALADIQRAAPGALLYRPRERAAQTEADRVSTPATDGDTSAQAAPDSQGAAQASSQETATPATQEAAPSGPRYLQVGAFDREESAQRLVGMLRDAGFAPTVSAPPEGKVTVLVGPYSGDALLRAEGRLDSAGMDHFRVR